METKSSECGCISHIGPHWLYMDFLDRERNLVHLEHAVRCAESASWRQLSLTMHAYMQADQARRKEKLYNMGCENAFVHNGESKEYPYSLLGIDSRIQQFEQRRRALLDRLKRAQFPDTTISVAS